VTLVAALGCGLIAGVFFALSVFVMKVLTRLCPGDGIAAMQSINVAVLNPSFMGACFGTAGACVLAVIAALLRWLEPVGRLCRQLEGLEPRSDGSGAGGSSFVQRCTWSLRSAFVTFAHQAQRKMTLPVTTAQQPVRRLASG
jgi:hypothetical protein